MCLDCSFSLCRRGEVKVMPDESSVTEGWPPNTSLPAAAMPRLTTMPPSRASSAAHPVCH